MKRTLLPALATGAVALVAGGAAAGAHPGAAAHTARGQTMTLTRVAKLGRILTDSGGHVVYLFEKDMHGKSACYGACATFWPPVITKGKPLARGGVSAAKLGTTKRRDGKLQVTYAGHPVYYFKGDAGKARRASGEGSKAFGASWYVLNAAGKKIDKS
jgi:predicted lipoprotein with Yx(FWY)xxD motif